MIKFRPVLGSVFFVFMLFALMRANYGKRLLKERAFARSLVSNGQAHYQNVGEMYKSLSMLRHDFKYHLMVIDGLLQAGCVKETEQYVADIKKQMPQDGMHYYCSNSVINALLSGYAKSCKELKIKYDVKIALPKTLSVHDYDMCIILGNLLENALEACSKSQGGEIMLSIKTTGSHLAIMVKNSFNGVVAKTNGKLISTKKGGGLGLPSIRAVIDNYDGRMMTEYDKEMFTVYVMVG
ncbi:MAG: GHKL domain-containing protein [Fibromonadaceae bacterium]|nr:GHKL domain-containing protein [Fibromonadaceae bacterium]